MHIHILGICGTFMGGIAAIARQSGHTVTGCDEHVYPPMSTQLGALGIDLHRGFDEEQIRTFSPDAFVVGNVMTRGMPVIERLLRDRTPLVSGPEWLYKNILRSQESILAIAGTHGKTTTASLAAWILEDNGHDPGFLIGGLPGNFETSARAGGGRLFVIEADEYDSAFFDKRSKFIHYRPDILLLNNLEFDHADIFTSLADIQRQFHHLLKLVPENGCVLANGDDTNLAAVLEQGIWSSLDCFGAPPQPWYIESMDSENFILGHDQDRVCVKTPIPGVHNQMNALAAVTACQRAGISFQAAARSLPGFIPPKRRLELKFSDGYLSVYDDFAHHPTAIANTISAVRARHCRQLIVVFEPRSNSMRSGAHDQGLKTAFAQADRILVYQARNCRHCCDFLRTRYGERLSIHTSTDEIIEHLQGSMVQNADVLFMSNGGFDNIVQRFIDTLD